MSERQTSTDSSAPIQRPDAKGPRRRPWMRWAVTAGILIAAGGALAALAMLPGREKKVESKPIPPVNVEIETVTPLASLAETFVLPGVVAANRVVNVSAEVAGRIEKLSCREGRPCTVGEKLMTLNTDLLSAEYRRAEATAKFNQRERTRLQSLRARGAATATELDQAKAQAEASQAAADLAEANLKRTVIAAPASGVLNRVPVEKGEYLQAGNKVAEIVQNRKVKVVVDVPERYIQRVRLGDTHDVLVGPDKHKKRFHGQVTYIAELADPVARTTRVELTVDNKGPGADLIVPNGLDAPKGGHAPTVILVRAARPGLKINDIKESVTEPLAQALGRVAGATGVRTGSEDGLGLVSVAFATTAPDQALAAVREQVRRVPPPDGAPAPTAEVFTLATYWDLARRGLRAGQIVQVDLKLRTLRDAVLVPLKAVIPLEKGKVVYVVKDGLAERRNVTLGFFKEWDVLVLSGLQAGDKLIVKGQHLIGPGQRVRIVAGDDKPATRPASQPASQPVTRPAAPPARPAPPKHPVRAEEGTGYFGFMARFPGDRVEGTRTFLPPGTSCRDTGAPGPAGETFMSPQPLRLPEGSAGPDGLSAACATSVWTSRVVDFGDMNLFSRGSDTWHTAGLGWRENRFVSPKPAPVSAGELSPESGHGPCFSAPRQADVQLKANPKSSLSPFLAGATVVRAEGETAVPGARLSGLLARPLAPAAGNDRGTRYSHPAGNSGSRPAAGGGSRP